MRLLCQPAVIHHGLTGQPATQLACRQTASQPEGLGRVASQPAARQASLLQRDGRSEDDRCASAGRARPRHTLYSLQIRLCTVGVLCTVCTVSVLCTVCSVQCVVYSVYCVVYSLQVYSAHRRMYIQCTGGGPAALALLSTLLGLSPVSSHRLARAWAG